MSTKKETSSTQTTAFDPRSMQRYQGWQGMMSPILQSLFQNPFSSPFYQANLQQNTRGASQLAGRGMSNALLNFQRSGIGAALRGGVGSGAWNQLMQGANRMGSNLQYQGWMNAINQAQSDRWNAASLGSSLFQPLVTGGSATQVQKTSGLGTWLPQVLGAGMSLATAGMGGFGGSSLASMFGGSAAKQMIGAPQTAETTNFPIPNALTGGPS